MSADGFPTGPPTPGRPALPARPYAPRAPSDAALDRARTRFAATRRLIEWEKRAGAVFFPIWLFLVLLAAAAWGAFSVLPTQIAAAAGFGVLALLFYGAWRFMRRPGVSDEAIQARLETGGAMERGTLSPLLDIPQGADPVAHALWVAAAKRAAAKLDDVPNARMHLRPLGFSRFALGSRALIALGVLPLLLIVAAVFLQPEAPRRVLATINPGVGALLGDAPLVIEAWALPPDYIDAAPLRLSDPVDDIAIMGLRWPGAAPEVSPNTSVVVRVSGPIAAPTLTRSGPGPNVKVKLTRAADGAWEGRVPVGARRGTIRLHRFGTLASWRLRAGPDAPPKVEFTQAPTRGVRDALEFEWAAQDDIGVASLHVEMTLVRPPPGLVDATPSEVAVPMEGDAKDAKGRARLDLTRHPWAGLPVSLRLVARDGGGQAALSEAVPFTIPERALTQPLALAAMEARRALVRETRDYGERPSAAPIIAGKSIDPSELVEPENRLVRAPPGVLRAHQLLAALTQEPQGFFTETPVYFGLVTARYALESMRATTESARVSDLLWDVAMRAEFGAGADTASSLEQAMQQLRAAIARGASAEEIRELADQARAAMAAHIQALGDAAEQAGQTQDGTDTSAQELASTDLEQLLADAEASAQRGDAADALQLLDTLQGLLENMQVRMGMSGDGGANGGSSGNSGQGGGAAAQLGAAISEQRDLRDESFRAGNEGRAPGGDAAARQGALADRLEQMQRNMPPGAEDGGNPLGDAVGAMREAQAALSQGDPRSAEQAQERALDGLRSASRQLAAANDEGQTAEDQGGQDPLGRSGSSGGGGGGDDVSVPETIDPQRARQILNDLRRRAADPRRPEEERAYLRRLLDRFGDGE
jgi:tetratricopeptide (TPR) repeat protein